MTRYSYALDTTYPPENVETQGLNPPRSRFYEAGQMVDKLNGHIAGLGFPSTVWTFDVLTQTMVNALRAICPGYSSDVYLTTRKPDGTFGNYAGVMVWPQQQMDKRNFNGRYLGLEFQFRQLVEYAPEELTVANVTVTPAGGDYVVQMDVTTLYPPETVTLSVTGTTDTTVEILNDTETYSITTTVATGTYTLTGTYSSETTGTFA